MLTPPSEERNAQDVVIIGFASWGGQVRVVKLVYTIWGVQVWMFKSVCASRVL
jgi:hypothetical protein